MAANRTQTPARRDPVRRAALARHRRRQIAYGTWQPHGDLVAVREHLASLRAAGMSQASVAAKAGVGLNTVNRLSRGRNREVTRHTAERLLAVRREGRRTLPVDATGVRRRLQALAALGWPASILADRYGCVTFVIYELRMATTVLGYTEDRVRALYDSLSMTPGPDPATRRRAEQRGWSPPLAWDDIDSPEAVPDQGAPSKANRAHFVQEARHLNALGESRESIAARLDVSPDYVRDLLNEPRADSDPVSVITHVEFHYAADDGVRKHIRTFDVTLDGQTDAQAFVDATLQEPACTHLTVRRNGLPQQLR